MHKIRRYDLDWIRVLVFDILIIYHVGMFFNSWGWHIKNNEIISWIEGPMLFTSYWRIPILFVVSGMGTRFALSSKSGTQYVKERVSRLLIPLIFGMLIIVTPQVYVERLSDGIDYTNFFSFYPDYFNGIYPEGNFSWHHLWFLPYLLLMSIFATPLFLSWRNPSSRIIAYFNKILGKSPLCLYALAIPLFIIQYCLSDLYPVTHALVGDWYALLYYFYLFVTGYILVSCGAHFWTAVKQVRWISLCIGVLAFYLILCLETDRISYHGVEVINTWAWILSIFGFASQYLNQESKLIKYRNKAVYPFYILHQTITVVCGYCLMDLSWHYALKMLVMITITFLGSWVIYEFIILKLPFLQPLFGVKIKA